MSEAQDDGLSDEDFDRAMGEQASDAEGDAPLRDVALDGDEALGAS